MTQPVCIGMTEADIALLDHLVQELNSPNRSALVHQALCYLAEGYRGPNTLTKVAKAVRASKGVRQRTRPGTGALRSKVSAQIAD